MAEKGEEPMKAKTNPEASKFVWNLKNLFLNGIHVLVVVIALVAHPVVETNPDRALP